MASKKNTLPRSQRALVWAAEGLLNLTLERPYTQVHRYVLESRDDARLEAVQALIGVDKASRTYPDLLPLLALLRSRQFSYAATQAGVLLERDLGNRFLRLKLPLVDATPAGRFSDHIPGKLARMAEILGRIADDRDPASFPLAAPATQFRPLLAALERLSSLATDDACCARLFVLLEDICAHAFAHLLQVDERITRTGISRYATDEGIPTDFLLSTSGVACGQVPPLPVPAFQQTPF